jgi:hypothetical protein
MKITGRTWPSDRRAKQTTVTFVSDIAEVSSADISNDFNELAGTGHNSRINQIKYHLM